MNKFLFCLLFATLAAVKSFAVESFADLAEKTIPSVVNISTIQNNDDGFFEETDKMQTLGSGFIISEDGYIVTNNHVIDKAESINVIVGKDKKYMASLVGKDEKTDIALIKIVPEEKLIPAVFGDSDLIRVGDWVLAIGNPFGLGGSVTAGIISAKSRDIDSGSYDDFIQTDASINQGNSGGPMFNTKGEVIGMNTSIFSTTGSSMGIGFAMPSNQIVWVVNQLKTSGEVKRGWIGIKIQPDSLEYASKTEKGVLVLGVFENSPAEKAGITAGDIIVKINNKQIETPKNFSTFIAEKKAGEKVDFLVWNNKKFKNISIEATSAPEPAKKSSEKQKQEYYISQIGSVYVDENNNVVIENPEDNVYEQNLRKGDIIIKVDEYNVNNPQSVQKYIEEIEFSNNQTLNLSIMQNNELKNVTIKLESETNEQN